MGGANLAGVIWITGFSSAGKTTVGRKVEARLRNLGLSTIFLDGDDLRAIFAHHWGYDRSQRVDLAKVYFHLCSHLASQGFAVVISAVAMYAEVSAWIRNNIPRALQIYLDVPEEERRKRDGKTKRLYDKIDNSKSGYDEPSFADLVIQNHGGATPDSVADQIVEFYQSSRRRPLDFGRTNHWNHYYSSSSTPPLRPSPFAKTVVSRIGSPSRILEIGCGNGRDALYFAGLGYKVTALDLSEAAINICRESQGNLPVSFVAGRLPDLSAQYANAFDVAYCRFVLHAMPLEEEMATLMAAATVLVEGGKFYIECRSINDPMSRLGEVISPTERIHGHYRRFIIMDGLVERLQNAGFSVIEQTESNGMAVFGDEDPVVIRVLAKKTS